MLNLAFKNLEDLKNAYEEKKEKNFKIFKKEYQRLIKSLSVHNNSVNDLENLEKAKDMNLMPGNIRKVTHFFSFLKRFLSFLKNIMRQKDVLFYSTT